MNQKLILREKAKISKSKVLKDLEKSQVFVFSGKISSSAIASINQRYNHSNGKSAILLVNKIEESSFNANQIQAIRKYKGEYDTKLGYWFISV